MRPSVGRVYHRPVSEGWQPDEYPNDLKSLVAPMRVEPLYGFNMFQPENGDICGIFVRKVRT